MHVYLSDIKGLRDWIRMDTLDKDGWYVLKEDTPKEIKEEYQRIKIEYYKEKGEGWL